MKHECARRWTDSEIERLHRWFRYGGHEACCRHLRQRSSVAIYQKLRDEGLVGDPLPGPSKDARAACERWLSYCRAIGWKAADMTGLENLWWQHHDDGGQLIVGQPLAQTGGHQE